jgi:F-box protein 9
MPTSPSVKTYSKDEDDTAELARFRQEWLAELRLRKAELSGTVADTGTGTGTGTVPISVESTRQSQPPLLGTKEPIRQTLKENGSALAREAVPSRCIRATHPALNKDGRIASSFQISKALESALNLYRRAVLHEQRSELDQALLLYRQAFRLVCGRVFAMVFNHA